MGCGQSSSPTPTPTPSTDYTIQGKLSSLSASSIRASAADTVTHIYAIGSNGEKFLATLQSDGNFSVALNKGVPYALGFYNQSGGVITLLGYLKQEDAGWDSLPLMSPAGSSTDLGTIELSAGSVEATASIDLSSLISQMNLVDSATATYYGQIDGPMAVFTNVDVDGNGIFDSVEGKGYIFQTFINVEGGTGQIANMLNGNYNDSYVPVPASYTVVLAVQGDSQTAGADVIFNFPAEVYSSSGPGVTSVTASVESADSTTWSSFSKINGGPIFSPEVTPAGNYTIEVGSKTYTFNNYKASEIVAVNADDGIVYPVFSLVTNEAGIITTVNYKWKKLTAGVIGDASASDLKAAVEDTASNTTFVHTSPFISFFSDPNTLIGGIIKFDRDGSSVDVSSYSIALSDIHHIQASYNLTSRVVCKFDLY